ncbi:MAG: Gfo/Idh/MocA family oxidoreductase [Candidatus Omnitrophota bacterium]|nr:Gfo/Idh/MocA family oxidoreductase [Candidatus Omnitrophota bacterium]
MKQLKAGIIGLGVGEQHMAGYQSHPGCQVIALCDLSEEKLKEARKKYPRIRLTDNPDDILNDPEINVVSVASYDNYHYPQIIQAIKNNKHVFVEKPLCLYEEEARHIYSLLRSRVDLKLSSNLILRKCPRFIYLKKLIENGKLGGIFYVEGDYNYGRLNKITHGWRGKLDFYSVVYGGGIHIIDLLLWLTGQKIIEVTAYGNNISSSGFFKYNDMVVSILRFENGIVGKLAVNMGCVSPHFHSLSVYGTKGTFVNGLECGLYFESRDADRQPEKIYEDYPGVHKGALIYDFIDGIINKSTGAIPYQEVFDAMSVCFAIEKAAGEKNKVKVEYIQEVNK